MTGGGPTRSSLNTTRLGIRERLFAGCCVGVIARLGIGAVGGVLCLRGLLMSSD
jgi:hypothetical protein